MIMIVIARRLAANSAERWPSRKAGRDIGSELKRSMMPSPRSVAIDTPGPIIPKTIVWTRIPPIRYSW